MSLKNAEKYDSMLAELKTLQQKLTDTKYQKDLSFIEIIWNYHIYKNFSEQLSMFEHICKPYDTSSRKMLQYCLKHISRWPFLPFALAVYWNRTKTYFAAAARINRITKNFIPAAKRYCPCCGGHFKHFIDFNYIGFEYNPCLYPGYTRRKICPKCDSLPRHRIIAYYFNHRLDELKNKQILIFGMKSAEHRWLDRLKIKYQTADPYGAADLKYDIQNIDCPDEQYDIIICNHILEHVENYRKSLKEVYRVLKNNGLMILTIPTLWRLSSTFENHPADGQVEKILYYGQFDHLRIFGADIQKHLEAAGFSVEAVKGNKLPRKLQAVKGPAEYDDNIVWLCRKDSN